MTATTYRVARSKLSEDDQTKIRVARIINRYGLTFPETTREMRRRYGLSIYRLDKVGDISMGAISKIENALRIPSREMMERIADLLGATDDDRAILMRSAGYLADDDLAALGNADCCAIARMLNDPAMPETDRAHANAVMRGLRLILKKGRS